MQTFAESVQALWEANQWDEFKDLAPNWLMQMGWEADDRGLAIMDVPGYQAAAQLDAAVKAENPRAAYEAIREFRTHIPALMKFLSGNAEDFGDPWDEADPEFLDQVAALEGFVARSVMSRRGAEKKGPGFVRKVAFEILDAWDQLPHANSLEQPVRRSEVISFWDDYYRTSDIRKALKRLESEGYIERASAEGRGIWYIVTEKAGRRRTRRGKR